MPTFLVQQISKVLYYKLKCFSLIKKTFDKITINMLLYIKQTVKY